MFQIMLIHLRLPALLIFNFLLCELPFDCSVYKKARNEANLWLQNLGTTSIFMHSHRVYKTYLVPEYLKADLASVVLKTAVSCFQNSPFSALLCVNC